MLLDYLVVGHVTRDLTDGSFELGGTATYAARTARSFGCRVGVVTSTESNLDLKPALEHVVSTCLPATSSTVFRNQYLDEGRRQVVLGVARPLGASAVPEDWQSALVHIAPVARECDPALVKSFAGSFVGVTPQGWMRRWDDSGRVHRRDWEEAKEVLPYADAVVLSEEDVAGDRALVAAYARETRYLALTQGDAGCTVYAEGQARRISAPAFEELDATGAGDVFAASFFYALERGFDPWASARFANCLAARSVTRPGLLGTPRGEDVLDCRQSTLTAPEGDHAHRLRAG